MFYTHGKHICAQNQWIDMLSFYVIETFMKHKNKRKILKREKGGKNQLKDCPITRIDIFDFLLCYICSCQVQQSKIRFIRTLFSIAIKIGLYFFSYYIIELFELFILEIYPLQDRQPNYQYFVIDFNSLQNISHLTHEYKRKKSTMRQ